MDRTVQWIGAPPRARHAEGSVRRWMRIRYRAVRVRRSARRAARDNWIDGVSVWAFWGLHR